MASLHLSINEKIKERVRQIAQKKGSNISELTESYYLALIRQEEGEDIAPELLIRPKLQEPQNRQRAKDKYFEEKYGA